MNDHNYKISPDFPRIKGEDLRIFGILGNDILQEFDQYSLEKAVMFGSTCKVIKITNSYLSYGTGLNYIPPCDRPQQKKRIMGKDTDQ